MDEEGGWGGLEEGVKVGSEDEEGPGVVGGGLRDGQKDRLGMDEEGPGVVGGRLRVGSKDEEGPQGGLEEGVRDR